MAGPEDLSGFWLGFVGFLVGKFELPDMDRPCRINSIGCICRVCRVFIGEERPEEISAANTRGRSLSVGRPFWTPNGLQNATSGRSAICKSLRNLVGPPRFELGTSCTPNRVTGKLVLPYFQLLATKVVGRRLLKAVDLG